MRRVSRIALALVTCGVIIGAIVALYLWPTYVNSILHEDVKLSILGAHMDLRGKMTTGVYPKVCSWNEGSGTAKLAFSGHGSYTVTRIQARLGSGGSAGSTILLDLVLPDTINLPSTIDVGLGLEGYFGGCPKSSGLAGVLEESPELTIVMWGDKTVFGMTNRDVTTWASALMEITANVTQ